ncbi:hypothetical protein C351_03689 [Cryptococcus neoformans c8]|nr:hypothetical protein C353_01009 [Cryptococcus neoformans var. grubii AD1-83a]OXG62993.1 hypothetical protein C351_03689 [Cryptococcus neoformans var. grubii c8]OXG67480.1 hypothetical protein C354_01019 [Cryptococcus neoformans var. grubii MW-RSA1955]OXG71311.1 hypothetical protein C352_01027 [Cryptococcus neoformans var. grubii CHC193]OXH17273.1 hypothetical protein C369_00997 [Cryptococcus neoformans var. grubii A5-35-17]OXH19129.1 hypothetical protein C370_00988 [Cryptococcus neoformans 
MKLTGAALNKLACKTLELEEDPTTPVPPFYVDLLEKHLRKCPNDTNFIAELADPQNPNSTKGGNGFGLIVCLEDQCWKEIILSADPLRGDGGRQEGFGSFWNYQEHCKENEHIKRRNERCKKMGIPIQSSSSSLPVSSSHASSSRITSTLNPLSTPASSSRTNQSYTMPSASSSNSISKKTSRPSILDALASSPATMSMHSSSPVLSPQVITTPSRMTSAALSRNIAPHVKATPTSASKKLSSSDTHRPASSTSGSRALTARHSSSSDIVPINRVAELKNGGHNANGGSSTTHTAEPFASDRTPLAPLRRNAKGAIPKREPVRQRTVSDTVHNDDDDDDTTLPSIKEQDKAFYKKFAAKREPIAVAATSSFALSAGVPASTSADVKSSVSTGVPLRDFYSSLLNELKQGRNGLGIDVIPTQDKEQRYAAELQHLLKALAAFQNEKHKFRIILQRMKFLKDALCNFNTVRNYVSPPIDITLIFPRLRFIIEKGQIIMTRVTTNAIGQLLKLPCGCGDASHACDFRAFSKDSGISHYREPGVTSSSSQLAHVGPVTPSIPERVRIIDSLASILSVGRAYTSYSDDDMSDDDGPHDPRHEMHDYTHSVAESLTAFFSDNLKDFHADSDVDKGLQKLGLNSLSDFLPGLKIKLMPHQVLGVSFMVEKERDHRYRGGLNGDSMGLGKTVQSIATMVANPSQDVQCKTTLIIAPLALLSQWKNEIESKTTEGLMKVLIYHGPKRATTAAALKQYDVVLTTYGTLTSESASDKPSKRKVKSVDGNEEERSTPAKMVGPLMKVKWYRVILDEAHQIRNKNTRATKACWALRAHLRWCLSGTLVVNSLDDIYSHLHFLQISPSAQWDHFREHISKMQKRFPKLATSRVQAILRVCCVRRHKESELNGKKLLELPPKTTKIIDLQFTDEERQIYTAIENKYRVTFNSFLRKGTVMKHYSIMLVMLTRLRQLTCHPWLLRRNPNDIGDERDVVVTDDDLFGGLEAPKMDDISEQARASTLIGQEYVERVKILLAERMKRLEGVPPDGIDEADDGECSICYEQYNDERITPCCHSFCAECLGNIFNTAQGNADLGDDDVQAGRRKCPLCRSIIDRAKIFRASAFMPVENDGEDDEDDSWGFQAEEVDDEDVDIGAKLEELNDDDMSEKKKGKRKAVESLESKRKKRKGKSKDDEAADDKLQAVNDEVSIEDVLPSTKMKKLGELIDAIIEQDPSQKIIVFSQFVEYIDLCSIFLRRRNIPHAKYVGSMKQDEREDTIKDFNRPMEEDKSPRCLLMSLKCGGVGLNLCIANHVICLDLAWNAATENQAVDRAHRIGQTREVVVHRLVVENTIDQRLMDLQQQKQALSDGAMGEGAAAKLGRLNIQDLIKLFGVRNQDDE